MRWIDEIIVFVPLGLVVGIILYVCLTGWPA